jgi:hypothetical protein
MRSVFALRKTMARLASVRRRVRMGKISSNSPSAHCQLPRGPPHDRGCTRADGASGARIGAFALWCIPLTCASHICANGPSREQLASFNVALAGGEFQHGAVLTGSLANTWQPAFDAGCAFSPLFWEQGFWGDRPMTLVRLAVAMNVCSAVVGVPAVMPPARPRPNCSSVQTEPGVYSHAAARSSPGRNVFAITMPLACSNRP